MKILILIFLFFIRCFSIKIECDFKNKIFDFLSSRYSCEVISADFSDNSTFITDINGTHLQNYTDQSVKIVYWSQTNLTIIPKGFSSVFTKIYGFHYENCNIEDLNGDELNEYSSLFWFYLTSSNLKRIPGNFFTNKNELSFISFMDNKINFVGANLLDGLSSLNRVDFSGNECINQTAFQGPSINDLKDALITQCPAIISTTDLVTTTDFSTTNDLTTTTTTTKSPGTTTENAGIKMDFNKFLFVVLSLVYGTNFWVNFY